MYLFSLPVANEIAPRSEKQLKTETVCPTLPTPRLPTNKVLTHSFVKIRLGLDDDNDPYVSPANFSPTGVYGRATTKNVTDQ
jgi:hypothetical protein